MKKFQNILVAVDTRFDAHPALRWAVRLAKHNDAKLKIVDVLPDLPWVAKLAISDAEETQQALAERKNRRLEELARPVRDERIDVTTQLLYDKSSFAIIQEVLRSGHDLVVRATKGAHSGRTGFFGTTSMRLLRRCPCAVWLVRVDAPLRLDRVLVAIDPAPNDLTREAMNTAILELGKSIVEYEQGQLHVVHAWDFFGEHLLKSRYKQSELADAKRNAETRVAEALDSFLSRYGLSHQAEGVHLLCDEKGPGHGISHLAKREQIDLIVMGTVARSGLRGALLGNTAEQVLDRIECSVLALKPDGFDSSETDAEQ
jgi:nucleotide-binding universal stress UspA family protein